MRILITGGAGFIGVALANKLAALGHEVRVIDNLTAGHPERLDKRVHFTRGDVRDIPTLWTVLQKVECVFHLAARVSVSESIRYPVEYNEVNVGGTVSLMTAVRDVGVKRVILTSSGAVYGEQLCQPVAEAAPPHPTSPYAVSKLAAEQYVLTLGELFNIETVILRIFNAYGPGQQVPPAHPPVVPKFLKQVLTGGSVVILGDGEQTRDFVYISDVVDALIAAIFAVDLNRAIVNVGSGHEVSVKELVSTIENVVGREARVLHNHTESGGVARLVADIALARQKLGFVPRVDLAKGIRSLWEENELSD